MSKNQAVERSFKKEGHGCFRGKVSSLNDFKSIHVWSEHFGHEDAAIGLLVVFKDGHQGTTDCKSRAVEGVNELVLALSIFEPRLKSSGLEGFAVGDRADFAVGVLCWQPDFKIEGFGRTKAHVARAQGHDAVGQF